MSQEYDSGPDTREHIARVQSLMNECVANLYGRADVHDASKLQEPEKPIFDEMTPKLKGCTYGSDEYKGFLGEMKVALDHHYAANSHHPEHHKLGITGMSLMDLLEMLCDWKAAGERHADGSLGQSLEVNAARFNINVQTYHILENTAIELGWLTVT